MNWITHVLNSLLDVNESSNLGDSKSWQPVRIPKGARILIYPIQTLVNGIIWITLKYKGKDYHATKERFRETIDNYLTEALMNKSEAIFNYIKEFQPEHANNYIALIKQANTYLKESRLYKPEVIVNSDISDSFQELKKIDSSLEYIMNNGEEFFEQYDAQRAHLGPVFYRLIDDLLNSPQAPIMENCTKLEKIILGVYDFARKVNMNGPGYLGVKDDSIEIYMKLKKMHES